MSIVLLGSINTESIGAIFAGSAFWAIMNKSNISIVPIAADRWNGTKTTPRKEWTPNEAFAR